MFVSYKQEKKANSEYVYMKTFLLIYCAEISDYEFNENAKETKKDFIFFKLTKCYEFNREAVYIYI